MSILPGKKITYLRTWWQIAKTGVQRLFGLPMQAGAHAFSKKKTSKRVLDNPFFYFGLTSLVLFGLLFFSSGSLAELHYSSGSDTVVFNGFFNNAAGAATQEAFVSQSQGTAVETPDLKIVQDNFIAAITTPRAINPQTLGSLTGGEQAQVRKEVEEYTVEAGDTIQSVAASFNISVNTIAWANGLSKNAALKVGQNLTILPVSGVIHAVKSGDTITEIARTYKAKAQDIIDFNELANEGDIFIGDVLIVPNGTMPEKAKASNGQTPLPDSFFIFPTEGNISQGLHYYNGVDVANKCGTPVYAAAAGTVQRAVGNGKWNAGMGNHITVLHANGVSTYYGHLLSLFVKPGDQVNVGDRIGLMGRTGNATGCHVHFQVMGAANPLARYLVGALLQYK